MNELLKQFLDESRELLESAGAALLVLEEQPANSDALNNLFRYVHTIKGGAGLFEPPGLVPTLHAAEDLLDHLREHNIHLTADMTDVLLRAMDQVAAWFDILEQHGEISEDQAEIGAALANDLRAFLPDGEDAGQAGESATTEEEQEPLTWLDEVPAEISETLDELWAIEFAPAEDCFFTGGNPLATVMGTPNRRWLSIAPREPWGEGADFDPFRCNLIFRIISGAPRADIEKHFVYVEESCVIQSLTTQKTSGEDCAPTNTFAEQGGLAADILQFQLDALALSGSDDAWDGRTASAAAVLASIAETFGLSSIAPRIQVAAKNAIGDVTAKELRGLLVDAIGALKSADGAKASTPDSSVAPPPEEQQTGSKRHSTAVKVEQEVLDTMMKLVGEIIVAKNALPFLVKRAEDVHGNRRLSLEIKSEYEAINRIVEDMQASIMQMRMVPVSHVFQRYQRLVRDISRRLDKKVTLHMEGEDTKADKNIVEELADPLVHLIRNACDHGLETPRERTESGKSETGHITLSARQSEDQVVVAVRDDGRGINVDRVRKKAIENGIVTQEAAERLDDKAAMQLILQPGFSTADQISDLSGRGVGMDVVNSMVKRAGGRLWIDSTAGMGSEISIALPVSMAVSQVMMFEVGPTLYGISIENIVETVRLPAKEIHIFKSTEQILLRGRLIPLRRARSLFGLEKQEVEPDDEVSILVVRNGDQELGFVVDRVRSEADVKLEAIDDCLNAAGYFSGAALLGDGSIMLLINARELF